MSDIYAKPVVLNVINLKLQLIQTFLHLPHFLKNIGNLYFTVLSELNDIHTAKHCV